VTICNSCLDNFQLKWTLVDCSLHLDFFILLCQAVHRYQIIYFYIFELFFVILLYFAARSCVQYLSPWISTNKFYIPNRENKITKININVSLETEHIFCGSDFNFLGARNKVFAAFGFGVWNFLRHRWRENQNHSHQKYFRFQVILL